LPLDYSYGTLSVAAAIGDTTLSSAAFAGLPNGLYASTAILPIVLHNPATGVREMVWVTAHTGSSTSVTVLRGKEGTSAVAWPSGTQWIVAPTIARDGLGGYAASVLAAMTDAHVGQRALQTDTGIVVTNTYNAGWVVDAGLCFPTDVDHAQSSGANPPVPSTILVRAGYLSATTSFGGDVTVTYRNPFPTGTICAFLTSASGVLGPFQVTSSTASAFIVRCYHVSTSAATSAAVTFHYVAFGY
jgi:hypothetical protein